MIGSDRVGKQVALLLVDALVSRASPINVLDPDDVVLIEIRPGLNLNQERRDLPRIGEAVWLADRDVGGLVLA